MLDDDLKSYVDFSFSMMSSDWYKTEEEGRFTQYAFPAK